MKETPEERRERRKVLADRRGLREGCLAIGMLFLGMIVFLLIPDWMERTYPIWAFVYGCLLMGGIAAAVWFDCRKERESKEDED